MQEKKKRAEQLRQQLREAKERLASAEIELSTAKSNLDDCSEKLRQLKKAETALEARITEFTRTNMNCSIRPLVEKDQVALGAAEKLLADALSDLEYCRDGKSAEFYDTEYNHLQLQFRICSENVTSKRKVVNQLQAELNEVVKPPAAVVMPLPYNENAALAWIFHMHMPSWFRHLSRTSFLSAQLLLPSPAFVPDLDISAPSFKTNLVQHYNQQQSDKLYLASPTLHHGNSGCVELWSCDSVPGYVGPDHIDNVTSRSVEFYL